VPCPNNELIGLKDAKGRRRIGVFDPVFRRSTSSCLMKINWQIEARDTKPLREIVARRKLSNLVKRRTRKNVRRQGIVIGKGACWHVMVGCLLTTHQKAGPRSYVHRFLKSKADILSYRKCKASRSLRMMVRSDLKRFGGIYRIKIIANEIKANFQWLEAKNGWSILLSELRAIRATPTKTGERKLAHIVDELKGFGPKQSRNFIQWLGVSQYEIPLDSRIMDWLKKNDFPIPMSAKMLSDLDYYEFVLDGFQALCAKAHIFPCIADASIFTDVDEVQL